MKEARFRWENAEFEVSPMATPEGRWKSAIRQQATFGPHIEYTTEVSPTEYETAREAFQAGIARMNQLFPEATRVDVEAPD